jgi:hypothetical protein
MIPPSKKNIINSIVLLLSVVFIVNHLMVAMRPAPSLMKWFHIDDAFYYFQVARNVAEGDGFTFDGLGKSNGFHPLWMLINIPIFTLAKFNPYLPFRMLVMVSALITLLGGWVLFDLLKRILQIETALLGFAIWIFFWPIQGIITHTGMEAGVSAFTILLFLWMMNKLDRSRASHYLILGFTAALVLFSRLDNIFFILFAGVVLIFYQVPMRQLIVIDILVTFISVFCSIVLRVGTFESLGFLSSTKVFLLVAMTTRLITFYLLGLYQWPRTNRFFELLGRIIAAIALGSLVITLIMLLLIQFNLVINFPRSALLIEAGLTFALTFLFRMIIWVVQTPNKKVDLSFSTNGRYWLRRGIVYLLPIALLLIVYFLWNLWNFRTFMPISGQIKEWWGTMLTVYGRRHRNLWTIMGLIPLTQEDQQPWFLLHGYFYQPFLTLFNIDRIKQIPAYVSLKVLLTLIYGGLTALIISRRREGITKNFQGSGFLPLLAACLIQPLYYGFTGYLAMRSWYWVVQIITTILFFLILLDCVVDWLKQKGQVGKFIASFTYLLILLLAINSTIKIQHHFPVNITQENVYDYLKMVYYLEENTPPGSKIGLTGGGTEAYFIQDRTIINLDGLINSKEYFDLMKVGRANKYLDEIGLDFVLGNPEVFFKSDPYHWFFDDRLGKMEQYEDVFLFRYLAGR